MQSSHPVNLICKGWLWGSMQSCVDAPVSKPKTMPKLLLSLHFSLQLKLPGLGLFYTPDPSGIPLVLTHFLRNIEAVHQASRGSMGATVHCCT